MPEAKKPTRKPKAVEKKAAAIQEAPEEEKVYARIQSFKPEAGMPAALKEALEDKQVVQEVVGNLQSTGSMSFALARLIQHIEMDAPMLSQHFAAMGLHTAAGMFRSLAEMGRTCAKYVKEHIQTEPADGAS